MDYGIVVCEGRVFGPFTYYVATRSKRKRVSVIHHISIQIMKKMTFQSQEKKVIFSLLIISTCVDGMNLYLYS